MPGERHLVKTLRTSLQLVCHGHLRHPPATGTSEGQVYYVCMWLSLGGQVTSLAVTALVGNFPPVPCS